MNGSQITIATTVIANTLACGLSDDELTLIAAIFTQLGDTLATISAVRTICNNRSESDKTSQDNSYYESNNNDTSNQDTSTNTNENSNKK